jgi:hypothetical protein
MPWETEGSSKRRLELPPDWDAIRTRVGNRDGWKCQWPRSRGGVCGSKANQCDHKESGSDHSEANLWMLCQWHHMHKTGQASAESRRAQQAKGLHPVERHPGLLY